MDARAAPNAGWPQPSRGATGWWPALGAAPSGFGGVRVSKIGFVGKAGSPNSSRLPVRGGGGARPTLAFKYVYPQ